MRRIVLASLLSLAALLAACGDGNPPPSAAMPDPGLPAPLAPATYALGGAVSGLTGTTSLVLQNNAAGNLTVGANGTFTFASGVEAGAAYGVTVLTQPAHHLCSVAGGTGTMASSAVTGVNVSCERTARFAYAVAASSNSVVTFAIDPATGQFGAGTAAATGNTPQSLVVHPSQKFLYVANVFSNNLSGYSIDAATGALTPLPGSPYAAGSEPRSIAFTPSGAFAIVANHLDNNLALYAVDMATGVLTAVAGGTGATGQWPWYVAIDPTGRFAYSANTVGASISVFAIDTVAGTLTELAGSPYPAGSTNSFAFARSGATLYTTHSGANAAGAYSVDVATGELSAVAGSPFATGGNPQEIAVSPDGRFAYAANATTNDLSVFAVDAVSGALAPLQTIAAGGSPLGVTVDRTGRFVYVPTFTGGISAYRVDAVTGLLAPMPGSPFEAGTGFRRISTTAGPLP